MEDGEGRGSAQQAVIAQAQAVVDALPVRFLRQGERGKGGGGSGPEGGFPADLQGIAGSVFGEEEIPGLRCRLAAAVLAMAASMVVILFLSA